jgi:hypothetical protein
MASVGQADPDSRVTYPRGLGASEGAYELVNFHLSLRVSGLWKFVCRPSILVLLGSCRPSAIAGS